ncbi:MAG TPA: hypothetical protein VKS78_00435 [Roseiarcus sp.]|nr:hypothetical protein [Roseiarcus sp.]
MFGATNTTYDSVAIRIEPDPLRTGRFRWTLHIGPQVVLRSLRTYSDHDEAWLEAEQALDRRYDSPRSIIRPPKLV